MNTKLRQKAKYSFEKYFFKLMNNAVFGKFMENGRKYRDIKLATTEKRRNYLVSEPNYHTTKFFAENVLATDMKKGQILMSTPVYLGLSIIDLSKTAMCDFWYDYAKPKYCKNLKLCYMETGSFIVHVKQMMFTKILQKMLKKKIDSSNYEIGRPLPKGKNLKSDWIIER